MSTIKIEKAGAVVTATAIVSGKPIMTTAATLSEALLLLKAVIKTSQR